MYVVAIKDTAAWDGDTPGQLSMIGFWNLVVVWLKVGLSARLRRHGTSLIASCSYPGGFSDCGRCWMASTLRRI